MYTLTLSEQAATKGGGMIECAFAAFPVVGLTLEGVIDCLNHKVSPTYMIAPALITALFSLSGAGIADNWGYSYGVGGLTGGMFGIYLLNSKKMVTLE